MKKFLSICVVVGLMFMPLIASANTVASSTMYFQGELTDNGDGTYSGILAMIDEGGGDSGYDIYGEEGATAWFGNDPGSGPVWTSQAIGTDHDGWPTWTPDTPDWWQYSLNLYVDGGEQKWAVRNHPGATQENPWYDYGAPPMGVPMSGSMLWYSDGTAGYAEETDVGAYLPATGTPEIPGGAAGKGGSAHAWDMDWSWGSEVVPLEYPGFDVNVVDLGGGVYDVIMTPSVHQNTIPSSTMHFEGALADAGGGIYTGTIDMTSGGFYAEGGFDVYAEEGGTAYVTGSTWPIGSSHDAYSAAGPWGSWWDPDCPDWDKYSLELTADHWYLRYKDTGESPMSGVMDWSSIYAAETDLGTQDGSHDGSAAHGGGAGAWDWDCGWGVEVIPLELAGFAVEITDLGSGQYEVILTPASPETIWVDDDYCDVCANDGHTWGIDAFDNIQDGIDAVEGSTVNVAAGTYEEQVVIDKDLTLVGAGKDITVIQSPTTLTEYFTTSNDNYPIVYIHDADNVAIEELTVDGLGRGNSNYRFVGIGFWNAGGSATNVRLTTVRDTPFSGAQHGVSIYAHNDTDGPYTINIDNVNVDDMQKTGIALGGNGLTANVSNTTVIGQGPTLITAQNGIQIGFGATGSISDCEIADIFYPDISWSASGLLLYYPGSDVVLSNNNVHDCEGALNAYFADNLVMNNNNTFDQNDFLFIWGGDGINIDGNTFTSNSQALYIADATNLTASGNFFDNNDISIIIDGLTVTASFPENVITNSITAAVAIVPYGADEPTGITFSNNNIYGNGFGIDNSTSNMVDAENNWWGDASGPYHENGNQGLGDSVSDNVDYCPWLNAEYPGGSPISTGPVENVDTGVTYCTIQGAIDDASPDDTINVASGTYNENVVIAKSLSLIGASSATTIINGNNVGNAVTITASDVMLSGFKVTGGWSNGGSVFTPYGGVVINGNGGSSALTGITIEDNAVVDNDGNGIFVSAAGDGGAANNVVIRNCDILNNVGGAGISLTYPWFTGTNDTCNGPEEEPYDEWRRSKNILMEENTLDGNGDYGIYVNAGRDNVIQSNSISNSVKYGLQLAASMPCTVIPCEYTTVEDNEIYDNQRNGVKLTSYNQYNTFAENEIYNNGTGGTSDRYKYGFLFQDGNNNTIQDNIISGNALGGLYLWGKGDPSYTWYNTTDNIIIRNAIYDHTGHGIYIPDQYGNPNSGFLNSHINYNTIMFNIAYGLENADDTQIVDAEYNWWGDFNGTGPFDPDGEDEADESTCYDPSTMKNDDGWGDNVSDNVDYCPWIPQPLDTDADGINNFMDNCPSMPNGPDEGTCVKTRAGGVIASYRVDENFITCESDGDCTPTDGTCGEEQGDYNDNSVGDVCECYADYDDDTFVDGGDLNKLKIDYGRIDCHTVPCDADGNDDGFVDGDDLNLLKNEYGRIFCPIP